jgi:hypothetical protein
MEIRKPLSKANVLEKVNQFDIFSCYCTPFKQLYRPFKSELRSDKRPTCSICKVGDKLIYRDFAESGTKDCFNYIMEKYSVSFLQALEMINQDFNLKLLSNIKLHGSRQVNPKKTSFNINDIPEMIIDIRVCLRKWTEADKDYWFGKYDITSKTLSKFGVYPLQGFFINNIYTRCGSNVYGYYFGKLPDAREAWKIYQPFADKELKWRSNCPEEIIQGWGQLPEEGEHLIITKSLKDVMTLYQIGIPAIAPQAESNNIAKDIIQDLRTRFKKITILYDNDEPGIKAATRIAEMHELPTIYMPEGTKDASDFVELYGADALKAHLFNDYGIHSNNSRMGS